MVSLIIVDYKSIKKTISYIMHFSQYCLDWKNYNCIIVDNNPCDDSKKLLEDILQVEGKDTLFINNKSFCITKYSLNGQPLIYCNTNNNLGYAKGNNLGTQIADQLFNSNIYLLSNNDLRFTKEFSTPYSIFKNNDKIGVVGPKIIDLEGNIQSPRIKVGIAKKLFAECWLSTWPFRRPVDIGNADECGICYWVSGCFMYVDAHKFREVERFDENTFMFAEEMILSERLLKKDYYCYFNNENLVVHEHGQSIKNNQMNRLAEKWALDSVQYYFAKYRNVSRFIICLSTINYKLYMFMRMLSGIIRHGKEA